MKIHDWLNNARHRLARVDISTAHLDSLVLLEDCLQRDRAYLLASPETELTSAQCKQLEDWLERRLAHEPLAYIRQKTEFYGREFYIDHRVLEPRPESETIIELLKTLAPADASIIDVGTGSGMLAITAQLELPQASVTATDIDPGCLAVARRNAETYQTSISFVEADLLQPAQSKLLTADVLLCNLPYVPDNFHINQAALHEPKQAIFGGPDGLDLYRRLFDQIEALQTKPKLIITESLPPQHTALTSIAMEHGYKQSTEDDFIQAFQPLS